MAVSQIGTRCIRLTAASDEISTAQVVNYIRWVGATSGDSLSITDGGSSVIVSSVAANDNFIDIIPLGFKVDNLTINTLGSGTVYVYTR